MNPSKTVAIPAIKRNSSIELLRILSMLMIVLSHICYHSGFDYTNSIMTVNRLFVQFGILGNLGVVIFVMISGYFLCGKSLQTKSLSRLFAQVWFYSIGLFLVCKIGFGYEYTMGQLWAVFLPTIFNEYWFFTVYFLLLLLTPFLNMLIREMSRNLYHALLAGMLVLWVVIPTFTNQQMYGSELPQFVLFYLTGAYFNRFPNTIFRKKGWLPVGLTVGSFLVLYGLTVALGYFERFAPEAFGAANRFYNRNSLLIVGSGLGLFTFFIHCRPFTNRFINIVSGCTFGVYLIHDNPVIREILWKKLLNQTLYFTSGSFIPRLVACVLLVYIVCTVIEYLRQKTVAVPMTNGIDAVLNRIIGRIRRYSKNDDSTYELER